MRDLGGMVGAGGRTLKQGLVYRSAKVSGATAGDIDALSTSLGIRTIIDLRGRAGESNAIREKYPVVKDAAAVVDAKQCTHPVKYINRDIYNSMGKRIGRIGVAGLLLGYSLVKFIGLFKAWSPWPVRGWLGALMGRMQYYTLTYTLCRARDGFGGLYFDMAHKNPVKVAQAIRTIAAPENLPALFHCTSGKDRTGITAALLLSAVGVQRKDIVEDYHASHAFGMSREHIQDVIGVAEDEIVPASWLHDDAPIVMLLGAKRASIERFLDLIDSEYGSTEAYLDAVGLDASWRSELQSRWLE